MTPKSLLILLATGLYLPCPSQESPTEVDKIRGFPRNFFNAVNKKTTSIESELDRQTEKYLRQLFREEQRLPKEIEQGRFCG